MGENTVALKNMLTKCVKDRRPRRINLTDPYGRLSRMESECIDPWWCHFGIGLCNRHCSSRCLGDYQYSGAPLSLIHLSYQTIPYRYNFSNQDGALNNPFVKACSNLYPANATIIDEVVSFDKVHSTSTVLKDATLTLANGKKVTGYDYVSQTYL